MYKRNCRCHRDLGSERKFETAFAIAHLPKWVEARGMDVITRGGSWHSEDPSPMPPQFFKRVAGKEARMVHQTVPPQFTPSMSLSSHQLLDVATSPGADSSGSAVGNQLHGRFLPRSGLAKTRTRDMPRHAPVIRSCCLCVLCGPIWSELPLLCAPWSSRATLPR